MWYEAAQPAACCSTFPITDGLFHPQPAIWIESYSSKRHAMPGSGLNYDYVLQRALSLSPNKNPRVLDYGSGQGQLIALGLKNNIDIFGTDVPGIETNDRVRLIENGRIPFDDNSFDVVVSNQVFEHIAYLPPVLSEIRRVLRPGGTFLALFPDDSVWFEGHVGLYFVHWLMPYPKVLRIYLLACYKMGFGYFRNGKSATEWTNWVFWLMETDVFYHARSNVQKWWHETFGDRPESLASDWMRFRIAASPRFRPLQKIASPRWLIAPLGFICRIRAGLVLRAQKNN
jgi:SAM-dependent methyltransferase